MDERARAQLPEAAQAARHVRGDDQSRPKCRRGSSGGWPAPGRRLEIGLATTETRQPPRAFTLDQSFQSLPNQARLLHETGEGLSLGDECIVERQSRTHPRTSYPRTDLASFDADSNAC